MQVTERMTVLECSGSTSTSNEDIAAPVGSKSAVALHEVIKYLQGENRQVAPFFECLKSKLLLNLSYINTFCLGYGTNDEC